MAVEICDNAVADGDHLVHFYEREAELAQTVGAYLESALDAGAVAVVIATEAHRRAFVAELRRAGIDPAAAERAGRLRLLDAEATMSTFIADGQIDAAAFRREVGGVVHEAVGTGRPLRAYGEMVALLWEAGDVLAAIELEKLWNDLACEVDFALLCAYRSVSVSGSDHAEALHQVCHLHSAMVPGPAREARPPTEIEISGRFPADHAAPRAARRLVADALERWGQDGPTLRDDAQLVVSELATNAVVHARSPFSVVVQAVGSGIRVSVRDASRREPTVGDAKPTAVSGRGLPLIAAVAADWGVEVTPDGKTVWAELHP